MKNLIFILVILSQVACQNNNITNERLSFKDDEFKRAWHVKDTTTIDLWFTSLADTLDDYAFYSRLSLISSVTGFCYGNADPTEKSYWVIPQDERLVNKRNVAKVYQLYRESCLFMQKTSWDETLPLQDRYWNDRTELEPEKLKLISQAIDSLCKQ